MTAGPLAVLDSDVRWTAGAASEAVRTAWAACHESTVRRRAAARDGEPTPRSQALGPPDGGQDLASVTAAINQLAVAGFDGVALHAGVVARAGAAVALPGASGHGKSTAVAAAMAAGLDYVSDEALCLRHDGAVVPYPKPLSLSAHSLRLLGASGPPGRDGECDGEGEVTLAPEALGSVTRRPWLTVAHVVLLERSADPAGPGELQELHPAEAFAALVPRCFHHYRQPGRTFSTLTACARSARAWRLVAGDPSQVATALARLLDDAASGA